MFVRQKPNKSGLISVQVIDKSQGRFRVIKTIGSSDDAKTIQEFVARGKRFIKDQTGVQEFDFEDYTKIYFKVLSTVQTHKLAGVDYVLGKLFDDIGFGQIQDPLFRDLVLYRLVYPKSKLKTTQYLFRYEQKAYSEDEIYRYMDKLQSTQKELVQQISYQHTLKVLDGVIQAVFYDVTTLYFEAEKEDELRRTGFSKDGKHQHPQIILGLLVSKNAYPLAYDIFEGNKFEGDTFLPLLDAFRQNYNLEKLTVVADAGLLSKNNIDLLVSKGYDFILGARIKNESHRIKDQILNLSLKKGESKIIQKGSLKLLVSYSEDRAKKDQHNREKGLKRLEKQVRTGRMSKSSINNKGYNKFLKLEGELNVIIDYQKVKLDARWDGLKGYLTNSKMNKKDILNNYNQLWQIEKAFRVAKTELKIRPIFHRRQRRIEAHICLNFTAYKVYKELERVLSEKKSKLSPETVIEILQSIFEISLLTPNNEIITMPLILTEEQKMVQEIFQF